MCDDRYTEYIADVKPNVECYYCQHCHAIFTVLNGGYIEKCPKCRTWEGQISQGMYNLIKWKRKMFRRLKSHAKP